MDISNLQTWKIEKSSNDYARLCKMVSCTVNSVRNWAITGVYDNTDNLKNVEETISILKNIADGKAEFVKYPKNTIKFSIIENVHSEDEANELWENQVISLVSVLNYYILKLKEFRNKFKKMPEPLSKECDIIISDFMPNFIKYLRKNNDYYTGNVVVMPSNAVFPEKL